MDIMKALAFAHRALAASYLFTLRGEDLPQRGSGRLTIDYHTAQSPPQIRNRRFATRREELAIDNLGIILTRREYHLDSCLSLAFGRANAVVTCKIDGARVRLVSFLPLGPGAAK